jgi:hypothetical protein
MQPKEREATGRPHDLQVHSILLGNSHFLDTSFQVEVSAFLKFRHNRREPFVLHFVMHPTGSSEEHPKKATWLLVCGQG